MKVKLVTDSTSCLTAKYLNEENIDCLESVILMDDKEYRDLSDLNREKFTESLQFLDPYPTTSIASPQSALDIYEKAIEDGYDEVFYIGLSPNVSSQFNVAKIAAQRVKDKIKITLYQSGLMGPSEGALVYNASQFLNKGKSVEEVIAILEKLKEKVYSAGCSINFDSLFRTGKVKKGVAISLMASALSLKPVFEINLDEGVVGIGGGTGFKSAIKKIKTAIQNKTTPNTQYDLFIADALAPVLRRKLEREIKDLLNINSTQYLHIPPVIAHSVGKGAVMVTVCPVIDE